MTKYTPKDWIRLLTRGRRKKYYNHIPANILRNLIYKQVWDTYFKFCFERNPWDKALSLYHWRIRNKNPKPTLSEFLKTVNPSHLSNFDIYAIDETIVADYVGLYENLDIDLAKITERLNLPDKPELPGAKQTYRKDRRPYQEIIGNDERDIISTICSREIARFGYAF